MKVSRFLFAVMTVLLVSFQPAWTGVNLHMDGLTPSHIGLDAEEDGLCHQVCEETTAVCIDSFVMERPNHETYPELSLIAPELSLDHPPQLSL